MESNRADESTPEVSEYNVFMDNIYGRRYLCGIGMHWTRIRDPTGELYCERCEMVVSDSAEWPWYAWPAHLAVDVAFIVGAAWMLTQGDWMWAFATSGIGLMFLTETILIYQKQEGFKEDNEFR